MRLAMRPIAFGVPLLLAIALVMVLALWTWGSGGGTGFTEKGKITGIIEYTVTGPDGVIKEHRLFPNTTTTNLLDGARARLGIDGTTVANTDLFNNIELCEAPTAVAATACTTVSSNANTTEDNPLEGNGVAGTTGIYTVTLTWNAIGAVTIEGFHLCKAAAVAGTACAVGDIGAFQDTGTIVLATGDSIQVQWTVTIA